MRSRLLCLAAASLSICLVSAPPSQGESPKSDVPTQVEVLDMSPDRRAAWSMRYLFAPLASVFRGADYMYEPRRIRVETTPPGGYLDLFYVRSGFQKRFEQAEAPLMVLLPSRVDAGPRDSITIRAFVEGHRQRSVTFKVRSNVDHVEIDLEPLPNSLEGISHRYFAGRSSVGFLTHESLVFRLQEADDGIAVILNETAMAPAARASLEEIRSPLIREGFGQQLGEDLMVKLVLSESALRGAVEFRSRQSYHAARDLHEFSVDLTPRDGGAQVVAEALAALARIEPVDASGCALVYDETLRAGLEPGALARALAPKGSFTDPYLRAAMRRLGEVSVDGVVDFVDGGRYRPGTPMELEMALSQAAGAKGFLAVLRRFVAQVEVAEYQREAVRSLVAPELSPRLFDPIAEAAEIAERRCEAGG